MMKKILFLVFMCVASLALHAQSLVPVTWSAYGLTFDAPKGILVEEETEETFLLNNSKYYITVQSLVSDGMTKEELDGMLKDYADDDGVKEQSEIQSFELSQFYVSMLEGVCEEDCCIYACLLSKDGGSCFYLSVIYAESEKKNAEKILNSFKMEEK